MNVIDQIRTRVTSSRMMQAPGVWLTPKEVEALCDVADRVGKIVAREVVDGVGYCPACRCHSSLEWECGCDYGHVRAALARLNGEEQ